MSKYQKAVEALKVSNNIAAEGDDKIVEAKGALETSKNLEANDILKLNAVEKAIKINETPLLLKALATIQAGKTTRANNTLEVMELLKTLEAEKVDNDKKVIEDIDFLTTLITKIKSDKQKRIIVENSDGSIRTILVPTTKTVLTIEEIVEKDRPEELQYRIADVSVQPANRTFREAWTDANPSNTIDVDMNKARVIQADRIEESKKKKRAVRVISCFMLIHCGITRGRYNFQHKRKLL